MDGDVIASFGQSLYSPYFRNNISYAKNTQDHDLIVQSVASMANLSIFADDGKPDTDPTDQGNQRDINTQLALSIALGLVAFLTFCV